MDDPDWSAFSLDQALSITEEERASFLADFDMSETEIGRLLSLDNSEFGINESQIEDMDTSNSTGRNLSTSSSSGGDYYTDSSTGGVYFANSSTGGDYYAISSNGGDYYANSSAIVESVADNSASVVSVTDNSASVESVTDNSASVESVADNSASVKIDTNRLGMKRPRGRPASEATLLKRRKEAEYIELKAEKENLIARIKMLEECVSKKMKPPESFSLNEEFGDSFLHRSEVLDGDLPFDKSLLPQIKISNTENSDTAGYQLSIPDIAGYQTSVIDTVGYQISVPDAAAYQISVTDTAGNHNSPNPERSPIPDNVANKIFKEPELQDSSATVLRTDNSEKKTVSKPTPNNATTSASTQENPIATPQAFAVALPTSSMPPPSGHMNNNMYYPTQNNGVNYYPHYADPQNNGVNYYPHYTDPQYSGLQSYSTINNNGMSYYPQNSDIFSYPDIANYFYPNQFLGHHNNNTQYLTHETPLQIVELPDEETNADHYVREEDELSAFWVTNSMMNINRKEVAKMIQRALKLRKGIDSLVQTGHHQNIGQLTAVIVVKTENLKKEMDHYRSNVTFGEEALIVEKFENKWPHNVPTVTFFKRFFSKF